ncbi:MAG: bifunctional methylenetetrahydrofolate dehydrogenase/methenyltetrahydrofolate cyclohydrolase FolD [Clostridiales bacterium]|nr:bifunctional methylenetetrahydrofolate dehydrogenase/methenyltetrahydrofolate cyclohydrolase FolD [Bacillota bacterium]NLL54390.1 bifunctional methylenetetrahydrofolate dehydrogenase/methenyltetrahydrofolate cyclohydrolase FolD [Clostridiales bacterium]
MSAVLMDGKALAERIKETLRERVDGMTIKPGLTVILAGEDPASKVYVRNKERACETVGIRSRVIRLPDAVSQEELLAHIDAANRDEAVHGILVQLPLPRHIDGAVVLKAIDPKKDVDGFHVENAGALLSGAPGIAPCTPSGIMELLKDSGVPLEGAHAVVVGRSNIVGKPVALLLLQANCTVTLCHSKTRDLAAVTRQADILVAAVGRPRFITRDMVKNGAAVVDVGVNRCADGSLCGDVDFEQVREVAGRITPVPGGVGPMTIAMLMANTLRAAEG